MPAFEIYAGSQAKATIAKHGFKAELFGAVLGASGGPKWFILKGLDQFLFGSWLQNIDHPIELLGSSAGAFRFASLSQSDPVGSIERLAQRYSTTVYSANPSAREITDHAQQLLNYVLGNNGVSEILGNTKFHSHFVVARCLGLVACDQPALQVLGLAQSFALNRLNRRHLKRQYQRVLFSHPQSQLTINDPYQIPTQNVELSQQNLFSALMASGSIPMVLESVRDIPGAGPGIYRDGGIVDYHFDLDVGLNSDPTKDGFLTLYPHFQAQVKAGWFDKSLKRPVCEKHYRNVVMICPSSELVKSLPYGKISDRKDFSELSPEQRLPYWQTVLEKSHQLADEFEVWLEQPNLDDIRPLPFL
ncbi:patatin-like phospholipase family protein [Alginatibacterium sediminis]|uniref:Patatin-like phospholipase family protein n=1 Tax=Alginatibacterium sediminis TaxID=2164068 RepID=A0A420E7W7_9ALTE|nr:patatin-like phospholipase family protein [Alginatibacterium sediminis]RKF14263.1 patatin-like phospholipase family protein [Alginatibacterium sediminis]